MRNSGLHNSGLHSSGLHSSWLHASWLRDPMVLGPAAAVIVLAGAAGVYASRRKRPTLEEIERERRDYLMEAGRIIDGTVLDLTDVEVAVKGSAPALRRFVFYRYEIAGVMYECSQDVTVLGEQMVGATSTPGMPTSVRYDPHSPTNSVVVTEGWTGLHHGNVVGRRPAVAG